MRIKNILLVVFLSVSTFPAFSQFTLGLKFSPLLSTNRIQEESDSLSMSTNGSGVRFAIGPFADFEIRENYYVSTGLLFISKRAGLEANSDNNSFKEAYGLQYLQVPITLKLYTNEVALDKKIYFQVGGTLEFKVNENAKEETNFLVDDFFFFDSSLLFGCGLEYKVGVNTALFGGFSYQRGLVNSVKNTGPVDGDFSLKNDYISLDLGIKF